jgi:zinc and cadmium transporter
LIWWILGFTVLASVGAVLGAGTLLWFPEATRRVLVPALISYATGLLLAAALVALIPEAIGEAPGGDPHKRVLPVLMTVLAGLIVFFVLEKVVLWRHCHKEHCDVHSAGGTLILIGDSFHNFVDGVVVAAAFLQSVELGMTTGVSLIIHELAQEVGDFGILIEHGFSRRKAVLYNVLSSTSSLPGALLGYFALSAVEKSIPYFLAFSAASFLYVALSDLVPGLQRQMSARANVVQFVLIILGIVTILLLGHGH